MQRECKLSTTIFWNDVLVSLISNSLFGTKASDVRENCLDILLRRDKFGHVGVSGRNSFGEGLFERVQRISFRQGTERRRIRMGALVRAGDAMTAGTIRLNQRLAAFDYGIAPCPRRASERHDYSKKALLHGDLELSVLGNGLRCHVLDGGRPVRIDA
jgi:hypothetical protein